MHTLFETKTLTKKNGWENSMNDFQTPVLTCKYMISLLPETATRILEPTKGIGNLQSEVEATGRICIAPDDYFLMDKKLRFDAIVMNPPFSSKFANMENAPIGINKYGMRLGYHILLECMEMSDTIIALMPWFTISDSDVRLRLLKNYGLKSLTALPRKTFQYARIQTMVIELVKGWSEKTEFKVYDLL